jgi:mono/diheme cytochrome c family protein
MVVVVLCGALSVARADQRDGAFLYGAYCASCHGADARGHGPEASLFSPPPRNLRGGTLASYTDEDLVERIRHGQPLKTVHDSAALKARAGDTEVLVGHLRRLPRIQWRLVDRGQEIYVDQCEVCHGPFGRASEALPNGVTTRPRDLGDPAYQKSVSDARLVDLVRHGHHGMPAIPGFGVKENRDALVAFLRLLSPGYENYSRSCAGCHGDDGRGPGVNWASVQRPTVVFDASYVAKKDPETLRIDVWHMTASAAPQMPHMSRVLRPSDVRAILTYLRSLPET